MKIKTTRHQNIQRINKTISIFRKYGFGYLLGKNGLKKYIPLTDKNETDEAVDENTLPYRLRLVFQELGTTYIKLGQTLSTRPDLVGNEIADELKLLQENNPPVPYNEIKEQIEKELGDSVENLFKEFDKNPIGTASIGQVHKATLHSGEKVAVKIQKQGIYDIVETDLRILKFIGEKSNKYVPITRTYNLPGIVSEFERSIKKEMDYTNELINMQHLTHDFRKDYTVHIPTSYPDYSTNKILTMEFIDGLKISDLFEKEIQGYDKKLIADRGVRAYFKQIFENGFFHADPHPGNIYILEDNIICFLDEGMMGILSKDFQENLAELIIFFMNRDIPNLIRQLTYMDIITGKTNIQVLEDDMEDMMSRYYGNDLKQMEGGLDDLIHLMTKHDVTLPKEFVLMARGIAMIEESGRKLDPEINVFELLKPSVRKIAMKKLNPLRTLTFLKENYFEFEHIMKILPRTINKVLYKIESGEVPVKIEIQQVDRIINQLSMSIIIAALLIGSSLVMLNQSGIKLLGLPIFGFIGFIISLILGIFVVLRYMKED